MRIINLAAFWGLGSTTITTSFRIVGSPFWPQLDIFFKWMMLEKHLFVTVFTWIASINNNCLCEYGSFMILWTLISYKVVYRRTIWNIFLELTQKIGNGRLFFSKFNLSRRFENYLPRKYWIFFLVPILIISTIKKM